MPEIKETKAPKEGIKQGIQSTYNGIPEVKIMPEIKETKAPKEGIKQGIQSTYNGIPEVKIMPEIKETKAPKEGIKQSVQDSSNIIITKKNISNSNKTTYAVYGIINSLVYGTDADNDGYYETYTFNIGIDADASPGPATVYGKMICNTTGQTWWSQSSWTVTGTTTDYKYFPFSQSDFSGYVTGNTNLDFTVEIWNSTKTTLLASDATVTGEPVKADYIVNNTYAVYGIINSLVYGTDADNDGYYETYTFNIGIDADASPGPATVYGKMICNTTGQTW
ncbi:MAG: hypothetical protein FJ218_07165, partial [Ignavibacteria bacterium]|nr:hypothetical protein [Ignavibacteria bacterium]